MSQIKMSVLMRIFPKSVKNGRNQASKFQENLEVFFCPFLEESNFRNKQSMVQYPRSYQRDKRIIEKEQNINRKYVIIRICQQLYFSDTLFS